MTAGQYRLGVQVAARLDAAREQRAELLRELWRMRRGPNRQGVSDRRRELRAVRERLRQVEGMAGVVRGWAASTQRGG